MRHPALPFALVVSLVLAPLAAAPARAADPLWRESPGATAPPDIVRPTDFMHDLSERMKPSLVQVRVRRAVEPAAEGSQEQPGSPEERRSAGSGFIIREDGYLVTNAHVVGDAERIQVRLSDGRRFDGRLVGLDERVDLALLNASFLVAATLWNDFPFSLPAVLDTAKWHITLWLVWAVATNGHATKAAAMSPISAQRAFTPAPRERAARAR